MVKNLRMEIEFTKTCLFKTKRERDWRARSHADYKIP
jgi:hypothetical protein